MAYQPSFAVKQKVLKNGDFIHVTFIPRKPHPNGLLAFLLASFIIHPLQPNRRLPFILDFIPHLRVGDATTGNVFSQFRDRWFLESKPHFISDSAFGSFDEMMEIQQWGGLWTTSMPSNANPTLWNVLSYNCAPKTWKAALNLHRIIVAEESKKIVCQQILSNGFDGSVHLAYGVNSDDSNNSGTIYVYLVTFKDGSGNLISLYSLDGLNDKTIPSLKDIRNQYNIPKGL